MIYARINLEKTDYSTLQSGWEFLRNPDIKELNTIYTQYCRYKKFSSVMPIFDIEYTDPRNDLIGYHDGPKLVAFSIIRKHDHDNVEAVQKAGVIVLGVLPQQLNGVLQEIKSSIDTQCVTCGFCPRYCDISKLRVCSDSQFLCHGKSS